MWRRRVCALQRNTVRRENDGVKTRWAYRAAMLVFAGCLTPLSHGAAPAKIGSGMQHQAPDSKERTDLNAATREELLRVPGMTRTWAERILRYRPYRTKKDLLDRGIVSPVVYARIKDYVIVHRETH